MNILLNGLLLLSMEVCSSFSFLLAIHHFAFIQGGADTVSSAISFKLAHFNCYCSIRVFQPYMRSSWP